MVSSMTRFGTTALLVSVLLSSAMPARASHLACKQHSTYGLGRGSDLDIAMSNAIQNWRVKTSSAYGDPYSYWYNTVNPGRHCNEAGGLTYCRIWAFPCR